MIRRRIGRAGQVCDSDPGDPFGLELGLVRGDIIAKRQHLIWHWHWHWHWHWYWYWYWYWGGGRGLRMVTAPTERAGSSPRYAAAIG